MKQDQQRESGQGNEKNPKQAFFHFQAGFTP
jgi:hypothetical protein